MSKGERKAAFLGVIFMIFTDFFETVKFIIGRTIMKNYEVARLSGLTTSFSDA
jgi:hypothetical protein